jgi:hypothetical protein
MALIEEASKAARTLVVRSEPNALCAAVLLAHALRRESVDFHVSFVRRLDEIVLASLGQEHPDCALLIGLSGDASASEIPAGRTLLLDSAPPSITADAQVHAEAALSSLAHLVGAGISKRNIDLAPLALAGASAAHRYVGGWRGLDADILREAVEEHVILREAALALHGATLLSALGQLDAPYVAGLTGRARNAKKLVGELKLSGDAPPGALSTDDAQKLGDFLALRLLQQGAPDAAFDTLFRPTLRGLAGPHMGLESGEMARLAEAACAADRCGLGFAALWPDSVAGGEMVDVQAQTRESIVQALIAAERDLKREGALLIAQAPSAALCRPLADRIAMSHAGAVVAVHAEDVVALRSWNVDVRALARKVGPSAGATAGDAHLWAPDATRALKALVEAMA